MPQIFQVLRCFKCLVFQVHQTKKSNKWECKLCGEKQSIKRHYGIGTAKDCRMHVQKLNGLRGELDELKSNLDPDSDNSETQVKVTSNHTLNLTDCQLTMKESKWSNYVEETESLDDKKNENINISPSAAEVVLEIPKKQRKFNNHFKRNPVDYCTMKGFRKKDRPLCDTVSNIHIESISIESKISEPDLISKNLILKQEFSITGANISKNKFIPPVINKNSKWAQFAEDTEENDEGDIIPSQSIESSQKDLLFSLCDDSDIDSILNI